MRPPPRPLPIPHRGVLHYIGISSVVGSSVYELSVGGLIDYLMFRALNDVELIVFKGIAYGYNNHSYNEHSLCYY